MILKVSHTIFSQFMDTSSQNLSFVFPCVQSHSTACVTFTVAKSCILCHRFRPLFKPPLQPKTKLFYISLLQKYAFLLAAIFYLKNGLIIEVILSVAIVYYAFLSFLTEFASNELQALIRWTDITYSKLISIHFLCPEICSQSASLFIWTCMRLQLQFTAFQVGNVK